jgi:hypothetical protein
MFPDICGYRTDTALAETRVSCFVLKRENMENLSKLQPGFAQKLEEVCSIKAVHYGLSKEAFEEFATSKTAHRSFSRMDLKIDKLQSELLTEYGAKLQRMGFRQSTRQNGLMYDVWLKSHRISGDDPPPTTLRTRMSSHTHTHTHSTHSHRHEHTHKLTHSLSLTSP